MNEVKLGNKIVGDGHPLYFIADIAANHDGDINRAFKLIEFAKEAGADAAKFQNFKAKNIVSRKGFDTLGGQLSHQSSWKKSVYEVYEDASLSYEWTRKLKEKCDDCDIEYFTSAYDFESVDHVDPYLNVYKIGSGDISWLEIIEYIVKKNKPVILATGASTMDDMTSPSLSGCLEYISQNSQGLLGVIISGKSLFDTRASTIPKGLAKRTVVN